MHPSRGASEIHFFEIHHHLQIYILQETGICDIHFMVWHHYYKASYPRGNTSKTKTKCVNNELNTSPILPLSQTESSSAECTYPSGALVWVSPSYLTPPMTHVLLPQLPKLAHLRLSSKKQFPSRFSHPFSDPFGTHYFLQTTGLKSAAQFARNLPVRTCFLVLLDLL